MNENLEMKGFHNIILSLCKTCFTYYSLAVSRASLVYATGVKSERKYC